MELEKLDIDCYVEDRICKLLKEEEIGSSIIHRRAHDHYRFIFKEKGEGKKNDKSNSNLHEYSSISYGG